MADSLNMSIKQKTLRINLDPKIYGSFAEIGAGQEVAASFFKSGGASGTIAKTMSAYDMKFSDAIYGPEESGRYVCLPRLIKMLDKEYRLLPERLPHKREKTCFFAYSNTMEALNYHRTNQGRGWMGVRFQLTPESPPNDCIIHILMHDNDNLLQQQAVGIVGVNLIYGCFNYSHQPEAFLNSLVDDLMPGRVEIDFFRLTGPDFEQFDNRLFSLKLVKNGLTKATMFGPDGDILQPAEELYKKNLLILRGRFRPVTKVNMDMIDTAIKEFKNEADVDSSKMRVITELTLSNLRTQNDDTIDDKDFLDRVDILCSMGLTVMISNYQEYYRLVTYLSKINRNQKIGIVLGIRNLAQLFDEKYYHNLQGGILASFGMLFGCNVKLYVYPSYADNNSNVLLNCDNFELPFHLFGLFRYLYDNERLMDLEDADTDILHIISDLVVSMIEKGEEGWEKMVPELVSDKIKKKKLFNYPGEVKTLVE